MSEFTHRHATRLDSGARVRRRAGRPASRHAESHDPGDDRRQHGLQTAVNSAGIVSEENFLRSTPWEEDPSRDQRLRSPIRTLLAFDQRVLADIVSLALSHGHYITRVASTGREACSAVAEWSPHLVVLDMDMEGNEMRQCFAAATLNGERLPVIAVTRRGDLEARLTAFEQGVDDILTVPFSPKELVARVVAVMRRTYRNAAVFSPLLRRAGLEIDILNRRVRTGGSELHLTSLELSLLYLLAANADRVLTRDEILDALWGADYVAESNVVDRHIRNLRVKLQKHFRQCIVTVAGRGYRFLPSPEAV